MITRAIIFGAAGMAMLLAIAAGNAVAQGEMFNPATRVKSLT
jgi:hypothetical protein